MAPLSLPAQSGRRVPVRFRLALTAGLLCALWPLAGCGETHDHASPAAEGAAAEVQHTAAPTLDACATLEAADPAAILGEAVGAALPVMNVTDEEGTRAVSQCVFASTTSDKSVSLFLRYDATAEHPATRADFIAAERAGDALGMGEETAAALEAGQEIPGLGDLAFTYDLLGLNLYVFWDQHHQLLVTVNGLADKATALARAQAVARHVLG